MDERPSGYAGFGMSVHLAIPFLGLALVDNTYPERLAKVCPEEGRNEFLFTATPIPTRGQHGRARASDGHLLTHWPSSLVSGHLTPREHVPLAPRCSMGVGGPARYFVEAHDEATVREALAWARARGQALRILGGGTNLLVTDEGVDGLVLAVDVRGVSVHTDNEAVELTAGAGEPWDDLVRLTVERGWAGLECLSGIPGLVGATPIQNVGAYGQEVSETVVSVRALDTHDGAVHALSPAECGFAYRDSVFKSGAPGRWVVLAVRYRLRPGGAPTVRYAEVEQHLAARGLADGVAGRCAGERARHPARQVDGARSRRRQPAKLRLVLREPHRLRRAR